MVSFEESGREGQQLGGKSRRPQAVPREGRRRELGFLDVDRCKAVSARADKQAVAVAGCAGLAPRR